MHESRPILLSGRIVLPDGGARQRYVLVRDGVIRWISRSRPPAAWTEGAKEVVTGSQDWIFPGLIDLHTHTWYNLLPLWHSDRAPFDHRHVWRSDAGYRAAIGGVLGQLEGHVEARKVFSELQAVAGGTTLLEEPRPLDAEESTGATLLCRDTGSPRDLGLENGKEMRSFVDFFKPGRSGQPEPAKGRDGKPGALEAYLNDRKRLQATLVHVAEGRSGFGSDRGVDPYSRAEFEALMEHPAMKDAGAFRDSRFAIVHGCGIDVEDPKHVDFLVERGISVIWSPTSNLLLYGDTIDAEALIQRGVNVALGSDWSPSGTKHVWDEAKLARFFLSAIGSTVSDADVFRMVTTAPGRCLGLPRFGRIEEGAAADFFVLRSPIESDSALEVLFSTTDRDVLATIVGGLPIYGDRGFLEAFELDLQDLPEREGSAVANKAVHLPASTQVEDFADEITAVEDQMKALDPPTLRSNLLASSDTPYLRRMQFLRARTERFGWSVKRWKKKGAGKTPGRVPVAPNAVRMRVGFRAAADHERFLHDLGRTLLPARVAISRSAGLSACFSAVAPADKPSGCPDEVGLDFYESRDAHERAASTVGGRLTSLLGETFFSDGAGSRSACPRPYDGEVAADACYYLFDEDVDWHHGEVRVLLAARRLRAQVADFHSAVVATLDQVVGLAADLDGALAAVGADYLALWQHARTGRQIVGEAPEALAAVASAVLDESPGQVDVKAALTDSWPGLDLRAGGCFRLVFERRALVPW